jgi:sulfite reductase alpha subunit-like flavoprotein
MSSRMITSAGQDVHPTQPIEQLRHRFNRLARSTRKLHRVEPKSITHVDVILGSLTATSEELAFSLVEKARQRGADVAFESLHTFDPDQLVGPESPYRSPSRLVVFVMSTHMAGRPSSNAESFLHWLQQPPEEVSDPESEFLQCKEPDFSTSAEPSAPSCSTASFSSGSPRKQRNLALQGSQHQASSTISQPRASLNWRNPFGGGNASACRPDGPLSGVQYAVFGVGNSIYRTYNATAKYADARLHELGAVRVFPLGLGDVSKLIDVTFAKWEAQLLQLISRPLDTSKVSTTEPTVAGSTKLQLAASASCTSESSDRNSNAQEMAQGPSLVNLTAQTQSQRPPLARSSSFAKLLMRRRSTLNPSSAVVFMSPLPPLK